MATELLLEVSQDAAERARIRSRKKFLMDETSNMITKKKIMEKSWAEGKAEIIELLDKGVSIDEIKTRLGL
jgi:hypothetical protein